VRYYPIYLDISNKRCTVIGGGDVAVRKVMRLLACGARVNVVGTALAPEMEALKSGRRIDHVPSDYREELLEGAFLVIGATDSTRVNERVYRDARNRGILVNIVDDPELCDFILPSLVERGDLSIAVSTGGKSPALARKMRVELEERYGPEYDAFIRVLGILRERVLQRGNSPEANRQIFESVVHSDVLEKIRRKDWDGVRKQIRELTGETINDIGTGE
jgi:precorrin-2 dehydrogenase/sirohydrochlorin ferrochelatase